MKKIFALFTMILGLFFTVSCDDNYHGLMGEGNTPNPPVENDTIVRWFIIEEDGTATLLNGDTLPVYYGRDYVAKVSVMPDTAYAKAEEAWDLNDESQKKPNYFIVSGTSSFEFNFGTLSALDSVYALHNERRIPLLDPQNLFNEIDNVKVVREDKNPYESEAKASCLLKYKRVTFTLAADTSVLIAASNYIIKIKRVMWSFLHNAFIREAELSNNSVSVLCNNTATFWKLFDDTSHRDSMEVHCNVENKFNMTIPEMIVENKNSLYNKSFNFVAETATVQGNIIKAEWQSAAIINNLYYNSVNYKDSIAPCVAYAKNLVFNADATAITVYFFEKGVDNSNDYATVTIPVKVTETEKLFAHKAFRQNATVNGSNIAIICDNTASFGNETVNYIVTNNFSYVIPAYLPTSVKGQSYTFNGNTAVVEGKNVTVTFSSRVIGNIIFDGIDYKDDKNVPQCAVEVKTVRFNESTATFTFTHEQEVITAEVPVTYNRIVKYELIGDPVHDMWGTVYGTAAGFAMTCDNHVVVSPIWADGTTGEAFNLPYVSTNMWNVEGQKNILIESLNSVIGVREEIVNGQATIGLSTVKFNHTMSAEKVTKDNFSYQPTPCEAVARYITVVSENTAVVEIFHDNDKIGEYELPIHLTEIIVIPGRIIRGNRSDAYADQVSARETWDFILASVNGRNTVYSKKENEKTFNNSEEIANFGAMTASDPFAYWYDASAGRHLGTLTAIKMDKNSKEAYFIQYLDFNKQVMYTLGTAEDALNNNYRNPERATLERVVKNGKVLWTDGQVFYRGTED